MNPVGGSIIIILTGYWDLESDNKNNNYYVFVCLRKAIYQSVQ